jgi:hypothetical protein
MQFCGADSARGGNTSRCQCMPARLGVQACLPHCVCPAWAGSCPGVQSGAGVCVLGCGAGGGGVKYAAGSWYRGAGCAGHADVCLTLAPAPSAPRRSCLGASYPSCHCCWGGAAVAAAPREHMRRHCAMLADVWLAVPPRMARRPTLDLMVTGGCHTPARSPGWRVCGVAGVCRGVCAVPYASTAMKGVGVGHLSDRGWGQGCGDVGGVVLRLVDQLSVLVAGQGHLLVMTTCRPHQGGAGLPEECGREC